MRVRVSVRVGGRLTQFARRGVGLRLPRTASAPTLSRRAATSVQAISWVIEKSKHKGNSFVVLLMIANHAKSDGTGAWPSVSTLAKESRLSRRTVQRCLNRLSRPWSGRKNWQKEPPELKVLVRQGPHRSNLYDLPGVKLTQGGRQIVTTPASSFDALPASQVTHKPSLTVLKDKERPRAQSGADFPPVNIGTMTDEEWERHLDKLDPKRRCR